VHIDYSLKVARYLYNKKKNRNSVISPTQTWAYFNMARRLNKRQRSHSNVKVHVCFLRTFRLLT